MGRDRNAATPESVAVAVRAPPVAIACPLLALWGETGPLARTDVLETWRTWADDVRGAALPCGHHLPEEAPEETYAALRDFLGATAGAT